MVFKNEALLNGFLLNEKNKIAYEIKRIQMNQLTFFFHIMKYFRNNLYLSYRSIRIEFFY